MSKTTTYTVKIDEYSGTQIVGSFTNKREAISFANTYLKDQLGSCQRMYIVKEVIETTSTDPHSRYHPFSDKEI